MGKRRTQSPSVTPYYGKRAGTKRSDRHWIDPQGNTWDSRYEYLVWRAYDNAGTKIRRTTKSDTFSFVLPIKRGKCAACGSDQVGQQRTYTPDFHVTADNAESKAEFYFIEAKGYLRSKERSLLRAFYKAHPDAPVRFLLQGNPPIGAKSKRTGEKGRLTDWFHKFLPRAKIAQWSGDVSKIWSSGDDLATEKVNSRKRKIPSPRAKRLRK